MARSRTVYHVVPNSSSELWFVTQEGGGLHEEHRTKDDAVNAARERARREAPAQVRVHFANGNIEYENTYAEDPTRTSR